MASYRSPGRLARASSIVFLVAELARPDVAALLARLGAESNCKPRHMWVQSPTPANVPRCPELFSWSRLDASFFPSLRQLVRSCVLRNKSDISGEPKLAPKWKRNHPTISKVFHVHLPCTTQSLFFSRSTPKCIGLTRPCGVRMRRRRKSACAPRQSNNSTRVPGAAA